MTKMVTVGSIAVLPGPVDGWGRPRGGLYALAAR